MTERPSKRQKTSNWSDELKDTLLHQQFLSWADRMHVMRKTCGFYDDVSQLVIDYEGTRLADVGTGILWRVEEYKGLDDLKMYFRCRANPEKKRFYPGIHLKRLTYTYGHIIKPSLQQYSIYIDNICDYYAMHDDLHAIYREILCACMIGWDTFVVENTTTSRQLELQGLTISENKHYDHPVVKIPYPVKDDYSENFPLFQS